MQKIWKRLIWGVLALMAVLIGLAFLYLADAYEPTEKAVEALQSTSDVLVEQNDSYTAFLSSESVTDTGMVFYQGGKVEEEAYAPLLWQLAEKGISVYLVSMPFNLAVLDIDAAQEVMDNENHIDTWYIAGHSLGAAMASSFAAESADRLNGVIFLAGYAATDLTGTDLPVLSIYGDRDTVLDQENFHEAMELVPSLELVVLEGGNHAQFGNYGPQEGDSQASISTKEQQALAVKYIMEFIKETV